MWKQMVDLGVALELRWLLNIGSSSNSICVYKGVLSISTAGMAPFFALQSVLHEVNPFPFPLLNANSSYVIGRRWLYMAHMHHRTVKYFSSDIPGGSEVGVWAQGRQRCSAPGAVGVKRALLKIQTGGGLAGIWTSNLLIRCIDTRLSIKPFKLDQVHTLRTSLLYLISGPSYTTIRVASCQQNKNAFYVTMFPTCIAIQVGLLVHWVDCFLATIEPLQSRFATGERLFRCGSERGRGVRICLNEPKRGKKHTRFWNGPSKRVRCEYTSTVAYYSPPMDSQTWCLWALELPVKLRHRLLVSGGPKFYGVPNMRTIHQTRLMRTHGSRTHLGLQRTTRLWEQNKKSPVHQRRPFWESPQ